MRLVSIGLGSCINAEDLAELVDQNVAILVGTPDELRAMAPFIVGKEVAVVDRDLKPENVWLVKDEQSLYLNATEGEPDVFARAQHCATRFADRETARAHARRYRKDGAHLVRICTSPQVSEGQGK